MPLLNNIRALNNALVAQLDRVLGYEPSGHRFESCRVRHILGTKIKRLDASLAVFFRPPFFPVGDSWDFPKMALLCSFRKRFFTSNSSTANST